MQTSTFFRFFPPPRYLVPPAAGLDISDQSVKWLGLRPIGSRLQVAGFGEKAIPVGVIESGKIRDKAALINILAELRSSTDLTHVVAALPEEESYIVRMKIPGVTLAELRGSIELQLEEYVPIPAGKAVFDYEIISHPTKQGKRVSGEYEVAVSVMPTETVDDYSGVMAAAGFNLQVFELEAQAVARAVLPPDGSEKPVMIVDFGKTRITFIIVWQGVVLLTSTVKNVGGEDLTTAIKKNLGVSAEEAERIKIEEGLLGARGKPELFTSLLPLVSVLRDEIKKQYDYWQSEAGRGRPPMEHLVLCGGQATLPGLAEYLALSLKLEVEVASVWTNVLDSTLISPPISRNQSLRYATALGLALRNVQHV